MPLNRKRSPVLKGSIPRNDFRMLKLEEEVLSRSIPSELSQDGSPVQLTIDEVSLLNEVLDTVEKGENRVSGINEATVFDRWLLSFQDQDHQFASPILVCEMKYNELLQVLILFRLEKLIC